jgi:uncharacterized protein YigE (DUF2233 family)
MNEFGGTQFEAARRMIRKTVLIVIAVLCAFPLAAADSDWTPVAPGVDYRRFKDEHTDIHVTRVDVTNPEIEVIATPQLYQGTTVSEFAKKTKAVVAINADYFDDKFNPRGLTIGPCGQWVGTKDTGREGVVAVGRGRALVQTQSQVFDPVEDWVTTAVSGWPMLVRDCAPLTATQLPGSDAFTRAPHPRTAVGASSDGKTLYLVVADGRRTGIPGMKLDELAKFMYEELGTCAAINLDGGGSTAMWVTDKIVNRPADGRERPVGDHLAIVLKSDYTGCPQPPQTASTTSTTITTVTTSTTTTTTPAVTTTTAPVTAPPVTTTNPPRPK